MPQPAWTSRRTPRSEQYCPSTMKSDITVLDVRTEFITIPRRVSFVFAKGTMTENLICNVGVTVANRAGAEAEGRGSIHLAAPWAFPTDAVSLEDKREAMKRTVLALADSLRSDGSYAHPIDYYWLRQAPILNAARAASLELNLAERLPPLAAYVCYAALDMALLDAFGRVNGINTYAALGVQYCPCDLSHYLGPDFRGKYLADYVRPSPQATVAFAHTVGGTDPLTRAEVPHDAQQDDLPLALEDWVRRDGARHLKLKLTGSDLSTALDRTIAVYHLAHELTDGAAHITADFNEACERPTWVIEYLTKLRERSLETFDSLLYVEQPFDRRAALTADEVAQVQALKPLVADEAITDTDSVRAIIDRGWAGIALKVAKVMSSGFLHIAAATEAGRFLTVQDLCNSGRAHLASVGLASRIPLLGGAECNGRQFVPSAFPEVRESHQDAFRFSDGVCHTASLQGVGLGF